MYEGTFYSWGMDFQKEQRFYIKIEIDSDFYQFYRY